jgi:hypothetical protein
MDANNTALKFRFSGNAEIHHFNIRKEGNEDEKQLAIDVKFQLDACSKILYFFDEQLEEFLYTDIGAVRNIFIAPIQIIGELSGYFLGIKYKGIELLDIFGVTLKKFVLEVKDEKKVAVIFQASFFTTKNEISQISEFLKEEIQIEVEPENGELDF